MSSASSSPGAALASTPLRSAVARSASTASKAGFTLIEVTVVLLVMAIAGWVVAAHITYSQVDQKAQLEVIKTHLRYAQARAMNTEIHWGIQFAGSRYWLFRVDPDDAAAGQEDTPVGIPGQDAAVVPLYSPLSATVLVTFDALGRPYRDARCQTPFGSTPLSLSADLPAIRITPNTGFIP